MRPGTDVKDHARHLDPIRKADGVHPDPLEQVLWIARGLPSVQQTEVLAEADLNCYVIEGDLQILLIVVVAREARMVEVRRNPPLADRQQAVVLRDKAHV